MSAKSEPQALVHPIPPLFDAQSRVLILGSFPSVKSREAKFFYGHPQNRFWRVLAALTGSPLPATIEEKTRLILENHFALWDSIASCTITGSSDSSIRDVVPNDLSVILDHAPSRRSSATARPPLPVTAGILSRSRTAQPPRFPPPVRPMPHGRWSV